MAYSNIASPLASASIGAPIHPAPAPSARLRNRQQLGARQPLFWAGLFFSVGIILGDYAWRPPIWWVLAGIVFVTSAICILKERTLAPKVLAFAALVAVGALSIQMRRSSASEQSLWLGSGEVQVTARIIAEGEIQPEGNSSFRQRVDIETETIDSASQTKRIAERIRLSVYQDGRGDSRDPMRLLSYGQRVRFRATLVPPRNYRNPGAFDYAGYLRDNGIVAGASVKYSAIEIVPRFVGNRVERWRALMHRRIIGKIHALWPDRRCRNAHFLHAGRPQPVVCLGIRGRLRARLNLRLLSRCVAVRRHRSHLGRSSGMALV